MPPTESAESGSQIVKGLLAGLACIATTAALVGGLIWLDMNGAPDIVLMPLLLAFMVGMVFAGRTYYRGQVARGKCQPMRAAMKRYQQRFLPAMGAYVVVFFTSTWVYRHYELAPPLLWLVALAPSLPLIGAIAAIGLYLKEEEDEFQRAKAVSSYVWATGLTLAISTIWGFLEQFHLAPHIPAWFVFPLLAICLVPSQAIVAWRYR